MAAWFKEGVAEKEIARRLGRDGNTIRRELACDKTRVAVGWNDWQMIYESDHAHGVPIHISQRREYERQKDVCITYDG